jgi:hypothetical protein
MASTVAPEADMADCCTIATLITEARRSVPLSQVGPSPLNARVIAERLGLCPARVVTQASLPFRGCTRSELIVAYACRLLGMSPDLSFLDGLVRGPLTVAPLACSEVWACSAFRTFFSSTPNAAPIARSVIPSRRSLRASPAIRWNPNNSRVNTANSKPTSPPVRIGRNRVHHLCPP